MEHETRGTLRPRHAGDRVSRRSIPLPPPSPLRFAFYYSAVSHGRFRRRKRVALRALHTGVASSFRVTRREFRPIHPVRQPALVALLSGLSTRGHDATHQQPQPLFTLELLVSGY